MGTAVILSDLHGDLETLAGIMKKTDLLRRLTQDAEAFLILLGDYGDRGPYSIEVYYLVLTLKLQFPKQVILLKGNHEGPEDLLPHPYDLPTQFNRRFGKEWQTPHKQIRRLYENLYNSVLIEKQYMLLHGGWPTTAEGLDDLAYAHTKHPTESFLEEILWNDPTETIEGARSSPRGAGRIFGQKITQDSMKKFGVKMLIRGHEPCRLGFKTNHEGKILTLFSRKGAPYMNIQGAYLDLDISQEIDEAEQLIHFIQKI
jgi:protein phosphatase